VIPIDVLVRPVTSDDIFEKALDMLEVVKIPARSWRDGGVAKSVVGILSEFGAIGVNVVASIVGGFFLAYATGDYLTAHAKDVYDTDRIAATFATGVVTLTNVRPLAHSIGANEMILRSSNTGARYRVTQAFTLDAGSTGTPETLDVTVSAIEAGAASTVAPEELDELETTISGVSCANEASIVGRDAESDEALRKRCMMKKGAWSPFGPRDAYEYAALTALLVDGTPTSITRVRVSRYSSTGHVTIVCATPSGTPSVDELAAVRASVEAIARPDSVTVTVSGATPVATSHEITIWANGGTETIIKANAEKALTAFISAYPIGGLAKSDGGQGYLYADAIAAAVIGSSPEAFDVDFEDGSDIELDDDEVATNTTTFVVRIR
jgi:phage-related baseplate assembly protein